MNTNGDNITELLQNNLVKIKRIWADIKAKQESGISLTKEEVTAGCEIPMILMKMGELTYLLEKYQTVASMCTTKKSSGGFRKSDMLGLTLELITMRNDEYRAPNNVFIFASNGTMTGPMTPSIASQTMDILEDLGVAKMLKSWEIDNRPIPEEYHHVFHTAFGFLPDASNKGES